MCIIVIKKGGKELDTEIKFALELLHLKFLVYA